MAKAKTVFFCTNCGYESPKWQGKCPACQEWNTFSDAPAPSKKSAGKDYREHKPVKLITEVSNATETRQSLPDQEFNRVLGGGLVAGSVSLIAGEPGIGKSTLLLQLAMQFKGGKVLYVSGEESAEQVAQRARRLGSLNEQCYIMTNADPDQIVGTATELDTNLVIVDSIQTLEASWLDATPGTISQIRESAARIIRFAKESGCPVFLIGHITKDGSIAGPKVLEHMVDTVLVFEGDQQHLFRLLRCTKNRFGSTLEIGIYLMESNGLTVVDNPSQLLIQQRGIDMSGSAIAAIVDGARPLIIEVQALASSAVFGTPQRSATGFDVRRLHMLLAVLEKRCGFKLGTKDVFLNMAGGLKIQDPAVDLAVAMAILSSSEDISLPGDCCFAAEIGLAGELRAISRIEQRISEAQKLGFRRIYIAESAGKLNPPKGQIEVITLNRVQDALPKIFG